MTRLGREEARRLIEAEIERRGLAPSVHVDADDFGNPIVFVTLDMYHLDADALNDRLQAWIAREVRPSFRHASAFVGFRHASPASDEDGTLDEEERWIGLEPTLRFDMERDEGDEKDLESFAALVPEFLRRVGASGRPSGWRDPTHGNLE